MNAARRPRALAARMFLERRVSVTRGRCMDCTSAELREAGRLQVVARAPLRGRQVANGPNSPSRRRTDRSLHGCFPEADLIYPRIGTRIYLGGRGKGREGGEREREEGITANRRDSRFWEIEGINRRVSVTVAKTVKRVGAIYREMNHRVCNKT